MLQIKSRSDQIASFGCASTVNGTMARSFLVSRTTTSRLAAGPEIAKYGYNEQILTETSFAVFKAVCPVGTVPRHYPTFRSGCSVGMYIQYCGEIWQSREWSESLSGWMDRGPVPRRSGPSSCSWAESSALPGVPLQAPPPPAANHSVHNCFSGRFILSIHAADLVPLPFSATAQLFSLLKNFAEDNNPCPASQYRVCPSLSTTRQRSGHAAQTAFAACPSSLTFFCRSQLQGPPQPPNPVRNTGHRGQNLPAVAALHTARFGLSSAADLGPGHPQLCSCSQSRARSHLDPPGTW